MTDITAKIGTFDSAKRSVPVTFTSGDVVHRRDVNAVLKDDGTYDRTATRTRVDEVALGVAQKISLGVITNEPVEEELPATQAPTE